MTEKILLPSTILFFILLTVLNFYLKGERYSLLAQSFLQGKTYFVSEPSYGWVDTVEFKGEHYWPSGPLPIFVVMPFVVIGSLFDIFFYQGYLQPLLIFLLFILIKTIARVLKYSLSDSNYLAFGFIFSTVFMNVGFWPEEWGFVQVLATIIMFFLLYAYIKKLPLWTMGIGIGLLSLTRPIASLAILFLITTVLSGKEVLQVKLKKLIILCLPLFIGILLFGLFNFVRFGNFFEQGYRDQMVSHPALFAARQYGLFNFVHIAGNLYYFLFSTPLPVFKDTVSHVLQFPFIRANPWGMSIFITSPIFIYLFVLSYKDKISKFLIATIILISIPIFLYYGIGWRQFGYRYSLDFLPLLYFLLMRNYKNTFAGLSNGFKIVILVSAITNFYFFVTAFSFP